MWFPFLMLLIMNFHKKFSQCRIIGFMRNLLAFVAMLSLSVQGLRADSVREGREAFAKGDFALAARSFETAVLSSEPRGGLYYNLAMAQMREGERAKAILSLRRALMLDSKMLDAKVALSDLERSQGIPLAGGGWREALHEKVSLPVVYVVGCGMAWIGAFMLLRALFLRKRKISSAAVAVGFVVLGALVLSAGVASDPRVLWEKAAVVVAEDGASLLSAPADQSAVVVRVPAGALVDISQRGSEWTYAVTPKGEKGWMPTSVLEAVVPGA